MQDINRNTQAFSYNPAINEEPEEEHRWGMLLDGGHAMLLGVVWSTDESIHLTTMFPYVVAIDTTYKTNIEKRPLFVAAGRDSE